ncbi:MAG: lactate permease LctP family transporter [Candidatus Solibacter usitatus]|nr:lactate permease LctP family transporter [Candidatus Solibacter usitatus]
MQTWTQTYDPLSNAALSTLVSAVPITLLFYLLAIRKTAAHMAAVYALAASVLVALFVFKMPPQMVAGATAHGAVYAIVWIAWVLIGAVFVYDLTVESGHFETIKGSIGALTDDRRLQLLLIAFAFGAVLEGAGGGGAPVAVTASMMIGLGFRPFETAVVCLMANTAPVAWGGMGNPVRALTAVTGLPEADLSATMGRILPPIAVILPFWLVRTQVGWRETFQVWPGCLAAGLAFGGIQFFWSNYVDASLVDIASGMGALVVCAVFFKFWRPSPVFRFPEERGMAQEARKLYSPGQVFHAWSPFLLIAVFVVLWGLPFVKKTIATTSVKVPVPGLHLMVVRTAPVVPADVHEPAVFGFDWLASVGTATFLAGLFAGPILGLSLGRTLRVFRHTCFRMRYSFLAILCMICLAYVTRYCGMDAVMGLAMTHTGVFYPIFGTFIGWLGVALSGTDAGSNALFGNLQVVTANKLGLSPVLMAAANSTGGVMGKMVGAQSLIVACVAAGIEGKEGDLFRAVFKHGLVLALLIGLIVTLYAYVLPQAVATNHHFW